MSEDFTSRTEWLLAKAAFREELDRLDIDGVDIRLDDSTDEHFSFTVELSRKRVDSEPEELLDQLNEQAGRDGTDQLSYEVDTPLNSSIDNIVDNTVEPSTDLWDIGSENAPITQREIDAMLEEVESDVFSLSDVTLGLWRTFDDAPSVDEIRSELESRAAAYGVDDMASAETMQERLEGATGQKQCPKGCGEMVYHLNPAGWVCPDCAEFASAVDDVNGTDDTDGTGGTGSTDDTDDTAPRERPTDISSGPDSPPQADSTVHR
ncbi:hypothetical protein [Halosegnis longus]|uniref:hypothetical protein n=1 Tax=Halosegnis longus TaxID=2216012 RepID=UPI00129D8B84|nr:hypothetical protein [Halosegnis longus]